jgi:hypothetical protein
VDESPRLLTAMLGGDRARRVAGAVLLAMAAAVLVSTLVGAGSSTVGGRLGGDYPAFYGAGRIVLAGDGTQLYDPARQSAEQQNLFGGDHGGYLSFAYPPQVAALYAPLAALPYRASYLLATALSAAAVALALRLVRPMLAIVQSAYLPCLALALGFYPLWRGVTGGQNTALTLLLVAWTWRSIVARHDLAAGVALGLLLGKPQFAVALVLVVLVLRRGRTLAAVAATGLASWGVAAIIAGPRWVGPWIRYATDFGTSDATVNRANAVSVLGVTDALFGAGAVVGRVVAAPMLLAAAAALVVLARRARRDPDAFTPLFALASVVVVLLAPHAMFYDAGLVVVALLVLACVPDGRANATAVLLWVAGLSQLAADSLGLSPLALVVPAAAIGVWWWSTAGDRQATASLPLPTLLGASR